MDWVKFLWDRKKLKLLYVFVKYVNILCEKKSNHLNIKFINYINSCLSYIFSKYFEMITLTCIKIIEIGDGSVIFYFLIIIGKIIGLNRSRKIEQSQNLHITYNYNI